MPRGGVRPGAGRKPDNSYRARVRALLNEYIDKDKETKILENIYYRAISGNSKIDSIAAARFLFEYKYGRAPQLLDETPERLMTAQAMFAEQQVIAGEVLARVKELLARASRSEIEVKMWPQQFVSEEEEIGNLQAIAASVNQPLVAMTPEQFQAIIENKTAAEALEILKGTLAKGQAEIIAEVMQYKAEGENNDDDEEE
jgi:hypothetical protein